MNALGLAIAWLRQRPLGTLLNILLLALGVASIALLLLLGRQLEERLVRDLAGVDLVVGAKGSPLQLILSTLFQIDVPTGNIPVEQAAVVTRHPLVARTIPLALGDSIGRFRIVGTEPAYLDLYGGSLVEGRLWEEPFEAVLGAAAADALDLELEDRFVGGHGLAAVGLVHADHPYAVVGILAPTGTVLDRLVLTATRSVWDIHAEHRGGGGPMLPAPEQHGHADGEGHRLDPDEIREITALLVLYRSPLAATQLPRLVNEQTALQAASPALEAARLFELLGVGLAGLRLFGILMVGMAALGILAALSRALDERRYDLALMRALGASRLRLVRQLLLEALLVGIAGLVLGLLVAHLTAAGMAAFVGRASQLGIGGLRPVLGELWLVVGVPAAAVAAAALPALRAYRVDVVRTLARRV